MTPDIPTDTISADAAADTARGVRLQIPSSPEWVRVVRLAVLGVASRMKFSYDDVEDIKLAVSEACNNAILHARAHDKNHGGAQEVEIEITPFRDRLEICVSDGGHVPSPGIVAARTEPFSSVAESSHDLRESGLGLFLMQSLMDEVEHRTGDEQNTEVRLTKFVPRI
ncbi:MAG TPA: ATP-binding protein [Abditibacteriaceae bacterium]|jgi:serine/threonine-protein kinase RsbW